jgi:hypothetical protein
VYLSRSADERRPEGRTIDADAGPAIPALGRQLALRGFGLGPRRQFDEATAPGTGEPRIPECLQTIQQLRHEWRALAQHRLDRVAARWQQALAPVALRLSREQGRLRWTRLKTMLQERVPSAPMLLIAPQGPRSRVLPREFRGLNRRHVLFDLQPGERMVTDIPAPLAGPFRWSGMIATFRAELTGTLEVRYEDNEGVFHAESLDLASLPDGATVPFRCPVRRAGRVRVNLTSRASGRLALFALGGLGRTTFPDTGYSCPMVFMV